MAIEFIRRHSDVLEPARSPRSVSVPGGRLAPARARLAAAEAVWRPFAAEHAALEAQRDHVLGEITKLTKPDTLRDRVRLSALEREREHLNEQMQVFCEDRDLPGGTRYAAYQEWHRSVFGLREIEGIIGQCQSRATELQEQLAPVLAELYELTGDAGKVKS